MKKMVMVVMMMVGLVSCAMAAGPKPSEPIEAVGGYPMEWVNNQPETVATMASVKDVLNQVGITDFSLEGLDNPSWEPHLIVLAKLSALGAVANKEGQTVGQYIWTDGEALIMVFFKPSSGDPNPVAVGLYKIIK